MTWIVRLVSADASSFGLGAVLRQKLPNGEEKIVAYASRSLSATESRYAQVENEALGITWAVEKLASFLIGKPFSVGTDHKPLVPLLSSKGLDERIQRFRMRLFRFQFQISHVPGKDLITEDALSRQPLPEYDDTDSILECEAENYTNSFIRSLPASEERLKQLYSYRTRTSSSKGSKLCVHRVAKYPERTVETVLEFTRRVIRRRWDITQRFEHCHTSINAPRGAVSTALKPPRCYQMP